MLPPYLSSVSIAGRIVAAALTQHGWSVEAPMMNEIGQIEMVLSGLRCAPLGKIFTAAARSCAEFLRYQPPATSLLMLLLLLLTLLHLPK